MKKFLCCVLVFAFALCLCTSPVTTPTGSTYHPPGSVTIDSIPNGANMRYAELTHSTSPAGWTTVVPWMQAVHNPNLGSASHVSVAYLRMYSVSTMGDTILLGSSYYDQKVFSTTNDGGMFSMQPSWFAVDTHTPMLASATSGLLEFDPSSDQMHIWHWWIDRALLPANSKFIFCQAKVLLSGAACIQMGADWWKTIDAQWAGLHVNNMEVGVTNWYFASPSWQMITLSTKQ